MVSKESQALHTLLTLSGCRILCNEACGSAMGFGGPYFNEIL